MFLNIFVFNIICQLFFRNYFYFHYLFFGLFSDQIYKIIVFKSFQMCAQSKNQVTKKKKNLQNQPFNRSHNIFLNHQNQCKRIDSTLPKQKGRISENLSLNKTYKNKPRLSNSLSRTVKGQNCSRNLSRKRLQSDFSLKQLKSRLSKTSEKKQQKYIFNAFKNSKEKQTLTIKPRNSVNSNHNKSYSNQTVIRGVHDKNCNFVFNKSSNNDLWKIKKKKHDYIKSFNKTSTMQKSLSTGFLSLGQELNETLMHVNLQKYNLDKSKCNNLDSSKLNSQQFQKLKQNHQNKLSQIRLNVNNLFKKIKSSEKSKLTLAANGYQKIVSELYSVLLQKATLPNCDLSRINTNNSTNLQNKENQSTALFTAKKSYSLAQQANHSKFQVVNPFQNSAQSQSQHWDSYLDQEQQNNRKTVIVRSIQKCPTVKKLNLQELKKQQIQQYHEQFMEKQQFFSDSWKRELNQGKRF